MKGLTAAKRGEAEGAIEDLSQFAKQDDLEALYWLAVSQRSLERFGEAAENFRRAAALNPENPVIYHDLGLCLAAQFDFEGAIAAFQKAIELKPDSAPPRHSLGLAYQSIGLRKEAADAFISAIALAPNDIHSYIAMAHLGVEADDQENALWFFRKAYEMEPHSYRGQVQLAHVLVHEKKYDEAENLLRKLIETRPKAASPYGLLAIVLHQLGRFEEANEITNKAIALGPLTTGYYTHFVAQRKITEQDRPFIDSMKQLVDHPRIGPLGAKDLYFAIGKSLNDLKEYKEAMDAFDKGNQLAWDCLPIHRRPNKEKYVQSLERLRAFYTPDFIKMESARVGSSSNRPIFIVGMPRSGTTLLDQILSSHHKIASAGELRFWAEIGHKSLMAAGAYSFSPEVPGEFLALLAQHDTVSERVIDKMPTNYLHLGMIRTYFPEAIILHSKRHPVDNCISMYTTPGLPDDFVHRKEDLVFLYGQYRLLMDYWTTIIPADRMLTVKYEELLSDPETIIRDVLSFCGLEWDPACLEHDQNAKAITTPSAWQARQPIYKTSMERWRNYEGWLEDFATLMPEQSKSQSSPSA